VSLYLTILSRIAVAQGTRRVNRAKVQYRLSFQFLSGYRLGSFRCNRFALNRGFGAVNRAKGHGRRAPSPGWFGEASDALDLAPMLYFPSAHASNSPVARSSPILARSN
jgi:hypothetical protein